MNNRCVKMVVLLRKIDPGHDHFATAFILSLNLYLQQKRLILIDIIGFIRPEMFMHRDGIGAALFRQPRALASVDNLSGTKRFTLGMHLLSRNRGLRSRCTPSSREESIKETSARGE